MHDHEKIRVLFFDDDVEVLDSFAKLIDKIKYDLVTATTPDQVMKKLQESDIEFDVAVLDMRYGEDKEAGLKLIKWLNTQKSIPEMVVLTAYGDFDNIVQCMEAGAFSYVEKGRKNTFDLLITDIDKAAEKHSQKYILQKNIIIQIKNIFDNLAYRDPFYIGHAERVKDWSIALANNLGLTKRDKIHLELATLLHDIGKNKLTYLYKPGKLTYEEKENLKKLPQYSRDIVKSFYESGGIDSKEVEKSNSITRRKMGWHWLS